MKQLNPKVYQKFHEHREEEGLAEAVFCLLVAMTDNESFAENVVEDIVYAIEPKDSNWIVDRLCELVEGYKLALTETI